MADLNEEITRVDEPIEKLINRIEEISPLAEATLEPPKEQITRAESEELPQAEADLGSLLLPQSDDILSPKRAFGSIVEDFAHFERLHARFPTEALIVFSSVATLREALRDFRDLAQGQE